VSFAPYTDACGSCHLAYQSGLLPERSSDRIMATLSDHFGDNAELDPAASSEIRRFLKQLSKERVVSFHGNLVRVHGREKLQRLVDEVK
jgi:hypothetical protein